MVFKLIDLISCFQKFYVFQGFEQSESVYSPYPDALLYMKYIIAVGQFLLMPLQEDEKIMKEINAGLVAQDEEPALNIKNSTTPNLNHTFLLETPAIEGIKVHDLSPTLWHSVDLYICVFEKNVAAFIHDAALSLIECSLRLNDEHW